MADEFDWEAIKNDDWSPPPPIGPNDELTTVTTQYGPMQKWKARALAIGWLQRQEQLARNDSADDQPMTTALGPEEKEPPALAADEVEHEARAGELSAEDFAALEDACDRLDARLTALEQRRRAENALIDAEAEIEKELEKLGHSSNDDEMTLH
jgi:hypothetical protein